MRIENIKIISYKGFKECSISFNPKVNVFIGSNGSGKSSILSAIIKSVFSIIRPFVQPGHRSKELDISPDDINYQANYCLITSRIDDFPGFQKPIETSVHAGTLSQDLLQVTSRIAREDREFIQWYQTLINTGPRTVPIVKFYPPNRGAVVYTDYSDPRSYPISQLETWGNIYQNSISYSKFFTWFFENETNELRLQRDANNFNIQNPVLRDVRIALVRAFEFIGYRNIKFKTKQLKREGNAKLVPYLILENEVTKQEESLDSKSDGEKAIISLIADIAYNLSIAKDFARDNDFLNSPGIVLIDELETHLHPNWQRQIIPILTSIFPAIQFFIATHSPQIVSSVNSESVFLCDNFNVDKVYLKTKGEDTNSLLKHIFNSTERPEEYIGLLNRFSLLIEQKASFSDIERVIQEIANIESEDKSGTISNLVGDLQLQLEAYKFDREYEKNN